MPTRRSVVHQFGAGLAALAAGSVANAETYPTHRVKIITTVAPGGTVDVLARLIAQKLSESLQQNFYVEDIPGGGGKMGAAAAARSAPDGYTLLFVFNSFITVVSLYSDVPYDPIKDFAPVTLVATSPYVLVVPPSLGISSGALDRILAPGGGSHDFHWIAPRTDSIAHSRREWDESNISGRTTPLKSLTELIQHNRPTS